MYTDVFFKQQFTPHHATGPKEIPADANAESSPLDFLSLFWFYQSPMLYGIF